LRKEIRHVIYIVKENRTYDQMFGDLPAGIGDPTLTQFPEAFTPNQHALAKEFVQLDNFYDPSNVTYEGWQWSTAARSVDATEKTYSVNYARRGLSYDSEGTDRNINVAYPTVAARQEANPATPNDPDLLPGPRNEEDIDGPGKRKRGGIHGARRKADEDDAAEEEGEGYLWDAAIRARLMVRSYGFHCDIVRYSLDPSAGGIPPIENPFATRTRVAFPAHKALMNRTDPYFRGYDVKFPDFFRYIEWAREFDDFVKSKSLPSLTLLRLMNDHTGAFAQAIRGINTPELQVADNDYAVGIVVDKVAHSPYAKSTLIFAIEDDAQDGPDHVDAHRSIALVAGAYVKQGQLVSERYSTVSLIRTIEEILGLPAQNLHDAGVRPMIEIFDLRPVGPTRLPHRRSCSAPSCRSSWCSRTFGAPTPLKRQSRCTTRGGGRSEPRISILRTPTRTTLRCITGCCGRVRWATNPTRPGAPGSISAAIEACCCSPPESADIRLAAEKIPLFGR
jgi:hypothetical protein